jgi:abhydrolase domain-containing protein 6
MAARTSLETAVLRTLRAHGPRLLGARRRTFRHWAGKSTPYLELGTEREGTLVFLHGFSDRPEHFLATAALLCDRYRILVPAVPCFGDGFRDPSADHSFEQFAEWMTEVVANIAPARFHLMGNSLGGAAALGVASRIPDRVETLTLVDTAGVKPIGVSCVFDNYGEGKNPFEVRDRADFDAFARTLSPRPNPAMAMFSNALFAEARANADWYSRLGRELGQSVKQFHAHGRDSFVRLESIHVPTLVVWGREDALFPLAVGEHLIRTMPNARLETYGGVGHCPHLEAPKLLARSFSAFARAPRSHAHQSSLDYLAGP